ncbi:MAG: rhomboid family intramembrane serine protease [Tannerellaceae bacterium]|jgi:membrane associated rhomboid family serine protease|nr:rhomboid family intramembrane serine protease [Tannerellaceae bacterium]
MENIFTNLKLSFSRGSILAKLIYINVGVFILIRLWDLFLLLFNITGFSLFDYVNMPSSPGMLLHRPWTIITYMFTHADFLHILFNMLWLYWFGRIFLQFFHPRQLGGIYVLGGIAGGLLFMLAYNVLPYFSSMSAGSSLMGASASVMAVVFAVSFYRKDYYIALLFLGRIKLIYLALGVFVFDLLAITSDGNPGGHIAHIGGALLGIWFASQISRGRDMTTAMNRAIDAFVNMWKRKPPRMRVTHKRRETRYEYNARRNTANAEIDVILDKLKRSGYAGLSSEEKRKLFDASKR